MSACVVVAAVALFLIAALRINAGIKESEAYRLAMVAVRADSRITTALGEPIESGYFLEGNVTGNPVQSFSGDVPLHGPKGRATMGISASQHDGVWQFKWLKVTIAGSGEVTDLRDQVNRGR